MAELLSADEVAAALGELDDWSGDTGGITRSAALPSFPVAISVVDRVASIAEQMNHHPDIDIRWRTVTFVCATHSAGGVTAKDIDLARQIDRVIAAAL